MAAFPFPWMPDLGWKALERSEPVSAPAVQWLSPTVVTYAGDREIEERVVSEIASFGKQLGVLSEALLELADDRPGKGVERLRSLVNRVEMVKARFNRGLEEKAEEAFKALLEADPAAAERLVTAWEQRLAQPEPAEAMPAETSSA